MSLCCQVDERRDAVRRLKGWSGLDYVEIDDSQVTLRVYFLGKLPPELQTNQPGLEKYLRIEGGHRVTDIQITDIDPVTDPDPENDDFLVVQLDQYGDFSTYTLRLVGVENIDPRYDHVDFSFKINCPSDLDCAPTCECELPVLEEPEINYLARDYGSFKQLIYDRLALLVPGWQERHAPDLGVALVELLAYTGDYLSYYQDAVATEAYLETARQRISVRRHARLVDYILHEGCNARAWVCLEVGADLTLNDPGDVSFITGLNNALGALPTVLNWDDLREVPADLYEVFEPLQPGRTAPLKFRSAHNQIDFYTWGDTQCCLERGSTSATLRDESHQLQLAPGDVLIFEEILGTKTGNAADADPNRRQAVRLTGVKPGRDPVGKTDYLEIEWAAEDALQFSFCLSAIGAAPACKFLENISVARGNVLLVDHGKTVGPENLGTVPTLQTEAECECANEPGDVRSIARRFRPQLGKTPLTFAQPLLPDAPAAGIFSQDVRSAGPQIWLESQPAAMWSTRPDLIGSTAREAHFVAEIDNAGVAQLRFGDGEMGSQASAGMAFSATYRIGNGTRGNVGAESISRLVLKNTKIDGAIIGVRNPLPAQGGLDAEPMAEAKLFAPFAFRKQLERAIIAADYEEIAERNPAVQNASAELVWTGSWNEVDVAIDPFARKTAEGSLLGKISDYLEDYRRIGHDLHVLPAEYVPLDLQLEVCALPYYQRAHVKAALLSLFSHRRFFHADNLTFGEGIYLSKIIAAAQAVPGVECVKVLRFQRLFEPSNLEIENGVLPLGVHEIAQLENDPNHPKRGKLDIQVHGGR